MEQNKMSPFPWSLQVFDKTEPIHIAIMCPSYGVATINYNPIVASISLADGEGVVNAVNATYGSGIDPTQVSELYHALLGLLLVSGSVPYTQGERTSAIERAEAAIEKAKL